MVDADGDREPGRRGVAAAAARGAGVAAVHAVLGQVEHQPRRVGHQEHQHCSYNCEQTSFRVHVHCSLCIYSSTYYHFMLVEIFSGSLLYTNI